MDRINIYGYCGMSKEIKIARAALHYWEEPCLSGNYGQVNADGTLDTNRIPGSGTVFFSGCTLRCVFCQNYDISTQGSGKVVTVERLSDIFLELQEKGAWNINLVTAGHFVLQVAEALRMAKERGLTLPVVYNSSGYERVETMKLLDGLVDIYLPDFKYVSEDLSKRYSGAADYFEVAKDALAEMVRQVGPAQMEDVVLESFTGRVEGAETVRMLKGVIVRHLLLPGCLMDSKRVVRYLYETYGNSIYYSLMNQYTPLPQVKEKYPELDACVKKKSYKKLVEYAMNLGIDHAFVQEGETAKESFIPAFDGEGV